MTQIKALIEGWTNADCEKLGQKPTTACTISLIRDKGIIALVDPGELPSQQVLIDALKRENLTKEDITHIFQTHYHVDHTRNTGLFPENVKVVNEFGVWQEGADEDLEFPNNYSENIKIILTPGHSHDGLSFAVKTDRGLVVICGDVFWKKDFPKFDQYAADMTELEKSRKKVLQIADYIIPGHGNIFKVKK